MTTTMEQLARGANDAFKNTAGFVSCQAASSAALEFRFTNGPDAERFKLSREVEPGSGRWSIDPNNPTVVINDRSAPEPIPATPAPVQPPTQNSTPPESAPRMPKAQSTTLLRLGLG